MNDATRGNKLGWLGVAAAVLVGAVLTVALWHGVTSSPPRPRADDPVVGGPDDPATGAGRPAGGVIETAQPSAPVHVVVRDRPDEVVDARPLAPIVFGGRVFDSNREAVAGARVDVFLSFGPPDGGRGGERHTGSATTDAGGSFSVPGILHQQAYVVRIGHDAFALARVAVDVGDALEGGAHEYTLWAGADLHGRVSAAGVGVGGARVVVSHVGDPAGADAVEHEAQSAADGTFTVAHVAPGTKVVRVSAPGLVPVTLAPMTFAGGTTTRALEVTLVPGAPLRGIIVRHGSEEPVGDAAVEARLLDVPPHLPPGLALVRGVTNAAGEFGFDAVAEGPYTVRAIPAGESAAVAEPVVVGATTAPRVTTAVRPGPTWWRLEIPSRTGEISGRVVDARTGLALTRCVVWLTQGTADAPPTATAYRQFVDDPDGRFEFRGVLPGVVRVNVKVDGLPVAQAGPFDLMRGEPVAGVQVAVEGGVLLRGRLLHARGGPAEGAVVRAVVVPRVADAARVAAGAADPGATGMSSAATATTDVHGLWSLRVRAGTWKLAVTHVDAVDLITDPLTATSGLVEVADMVLTPTARIFGSVMGADGQPDTEATIAARRDSGDPDAPAAVRGASTDSAGRFEIRGLGPGVWMVRCTRRQGAYDATAEREGRSPWTRVTLAVGEALRQDY